MEILLTDPKTPMVFLDNSILRSYTSSNQKHLSSSLGLMKAAGILEKESVILPSPFTLLEYCGVKLAGLLYPKIPPPQESESVDTCIQRTLQDALNFYENLQDLSTPSLLAMLERQCSFSRDAVEIKDLHAKLRQFIENPEYRYWLTTGLAWNHTSCLYTEYPATDRKRIEADHSLISKGLARRKEGIPVPISRRLNSVANITLRDDSYVIIDGKGHPIKQKFQFGTRDNYGDIELLDYALFGWMGNSVTCITADPPSVVILRFAIAKQLYKSFLEMFKESEQDMSVFQTLTPGKLCLMESNNKPPRVIDVDKITSDDILLSSL